MWHMAHAAELPLDLWAVFRDLRSSLLEVLARYFGDDEAIKFAFAGSGGYAGSISCGAGAVRAAMRQLHTERSQDLDF
jgi:hypothetical protein